ALPLSFAASGPASFRAAETSRSPRPSANVSAQPGRGRMPSARRVRRPAPAVNAREATGLTGDLPVHALGDGGAVPPARPESLRAPRRTGEPPTRLGARRGLVHEFLLTLPAVAAVGGHGQVATVDSGRPRGERERPRR